MKVPHRRRPSSRLERLLTRRVKPRAQHRDAAFPIDFIRGPAVVIAPTSHRDEAPADPAVRT